MAKQIIVLKVTNDASDGSGQLLVNALGWYAVAAGRETPVAGVSSTWSGASVAENAAIVAGSVIEEQVTLRYPAGTGKVAIQADLLARFTARQAQITAKPNPNAFFGVFYDPALTGWSA